MGRGTLQTNWDPDVMADNINPCWLAEEIFWLFFSQGGVSRGEEGKGDGILASRGDVPGQQWLSCKHCWVLQFPEIV